MASFKQKILKDLKARLKQASGLSLSSLQRAEYVAAVNWLSRYTPKQPLENLDWVRGDLEAFHHLCRVSDWTSAHRVAFAPAGESVTQELHERLFQWGYYREQQKLYECLLHRLTCEVDLVCFNGLGNLNDILGAPCQALNYHQQALALARKLGNADAETTALGNLGNVYLSLDQPQRARELYQQHLEQAQANRNHRSVGIALGNLGNVYRILEDYDRAVDCIRERLEIAQRVQDYRGEGDAYGNLGSVYTSQGRLEEALALQQKAIAIAQKIGNRLGECRAYGNLGLVHLAMGDKVQAVECFKLTLKLANTIEDREGQRLAILQLGTLCQQLNRYEEAINYQQQALGFVTDPMRAGALMLNLGTACRELGRGVAAIAWYEKLIAMAEQMISDGPEKRSFLMMGNYCLALVHQQMQQWQAAIAACDQALLHGGTQLLPLTERVEQLREQVLEHLASASILQG